MSMSANRATGRCTGSVYLLHSPSIVSSKRLITAVQLAHRFCINRHDDDLPSAASRTVRPTKTSSAIGCAVCVGMGCVENGNTGPCQHRTVTSRSQRAPTVSARLLGNVKLSVPAPRGGTAPYSVPRRCAYPFLPPSRPDKLSSCRSLSG